MPVQTHEAMSYLAVLDEQQSNLDRRYAFAQKMIGKKVHVYKLGGVRPEDDPNTEMFLPLPEYGIVLVTFRNPCTRLDEPVATHQGWVSSAGTGDGPITPMNA